MFKGEWASPTPRQPGSSRPVESRGPIGARMTRKQDHQSPKLSNEAKKQVRETWPSSANLMLHAPASPTLALYVSMCRLFSEPPAISTSSAPQPKPPLTSGPVGRFLRLQQTRRRSSQEPQSLLTRCLTWEGRCFQVRFSSVCGRRRTRCCSRKLARCRTWVGLR